MNINVTAAVLVSPTNPKLVISLNILRPQCTKYATAIMKEQQPQGGRIINNGR